MSPVWRDEFQPGFTLSKHARDTRACLDFEFEAYPSTWHRTFLKTFF